MRYLILALLSFLLLFTTACPFKKKKEVPPWKLYETNAQVAIDALRQFQTKDVDKLALATYKQELQPLDTTINNFLQNNQSAVTKESYKDIQAAQQDLHMITELLEKKVKSAQDNFFAGKLFAHMDTEFFTKIKERYKLGPELITSSYTYYYIDPVIREVWQTANGHVERAAKKLQDEVAAETKAAKAAAKAAKLGETETPKPTPTSSPTPTKTPDKPSPNSHKPEKPKTVSKPDKPQ